MARKSLGYTKTEWTCPNCDTVNPGTSRICVSCGSPQPEDVSFQQSLEEELITDEAEIAQAKKGPDIHCYYCGTRNPADAETCSQCGAALAEGIVREHGQVLGAHRDGPAPILTCPACGAENTAQARYCTTCGGSLAEVKEDILAESRPELAPKPKPAKKIKTLWVLGVIALVFLACACGFFVLSSRTEPVSARVESVSWTRSIEIMGLVNVEKEAWEDDLPSSAAALSCTSRVRRTVDEAPASGDYTEVCGTPYSVDLGNGYAEVVQDCQYQVYDNYCTYQVQEWQVVNQIQAEGSDYAPYWPRSNLGADQREGERSAQYQIVFNNDGEKHTFTTGDETLFQQAQIGSRWTLQVNTFGAVTGIEPAN